MASSIVGVMFLLLAGVQQTQADTSPAAVMRLVTLMTKLKMELEAEGVEAATSYQKAADHCKDTTKTLSTDIETAGAGVETSSTNLGTEFDLQTQLEADLKDRQTKHEETSSSLTDKVSWCTRQAAQYEYTSVDAKKTADTFKRAAQQVKDQTAKTKKDHGATPAKLEVAAEGPEMDGPLDEPEAPEMDGAPELPEMDGAELHEKNGAPRKTPPALLEFKKVDGTSMWVDPAVANIDALLVTMVTETEDHIKEIDAKHLKTKEACVTEKAGLSKVMTDNMEAMKQVKMDIAGAKKNVAEERKKLVGEQTSLEGYSKDLKKLTMGCETKARSFDASAKMRGSTVASLGKVLALWNPRAQELNNGETWQGRHADLVQKSGSIKKALLQVRRAKPVSFLQIAPVKAASTRFLATKSETSNSAAEQAKMEEVISFLRDESGKLSSPVLSVMAMRAAGDHFKKVEQMLQKLIQNLLSEENQDIAKSGFCDTEIAKANLDRDYALRKVRSISAELQLFESDKEKLDLAIETGTKAISDLEAFAQNATENRQHDHRVNVVTLAETKEGIGMLNQAKALYGDAAASRAKMASQQSATPVATTNEQTLGSGSQEIVMLLTGISRNLDAMVTDLEKQEKDAQATFTSDMSDNKVDVAGQKTTKTLNNQELDHTKSEIKKSLGDMATQQSLVDNALIVVKELKPVCQDPSGSNKAGRSLKRKQEIAALRTALTVLKGEGKAAPKAAPAAAAKGPSDELAPAPLK